MYRDTDQVGNWSEFRTKQEVESTKGRYKGRQ